MRHEISRLVDETQGTEGPPSEPHFDDEATLLSARRVVPFNKLTNKKNSKRNLFFGAALAAALMVGIIGGIIYARLERTPAPRAETTETAAQPLLEEDLVSSSEEQNSESPSVPDASETRAVDENEQKIVDKSHTRSTITRKPVALNATPAKRLQTEPDEWDYSWNERAIRRADRRAARRARREAAREAQRSDDLFRIQEIFEGSSKP